MRSAPSFPTRAARLGAVASALALLGGCHSVVFDPAGDVAHQQADLVIIATVLMLLIVVPVMVLIVLFAWRYRESNKDATYDPDWHHSTQLELVIWSAPLLIIIALGAVTWVGTHLLDPYRMIGRIDPNHAVAANARPLEVDVVALDWKWLFIYPEQRIATVNQLVLPTNRPLRFRITSATVMNSFFSPALAGQIYAMPGMETKLHAVLSREGSFTGFSANFSGAGFAHMHFAMKSVSPQAFEQWAAGVHGGANGGNLDRNAYLVLSKPSENDPQRTFASVAPDLFNAVVNLCVEPGKMCTSQMMALDARGGTGLAGSANVAMLTYDKYGRADSTPVVPGAMPGSRTALAHAFVKALCADGMPANVPLHEVAAPSDEMLHGAGLALPNGILSAKPSRPLS